MKRLPINTLMLAVLGLITLAVLLFNLPDQGVLAGYGGILIIYALLTAFALNFGVVVVEGELSPAHGVGMLVLLSLPHTVFSSSLWAIALGGAIGEVALALRTHQRQSSAHVILVVARITVSYYVAALVYNGALPLQTLHPEALLPVIIYGLVYSTVYFLLFLVEAFVEGKVITRPDLLEIGIVLVLPIPFSALGAVVFNTLSIIPFAIYLASFALILIRPHGITRSQHRLRRQVEELSSIAEMSKAIRANLELDDLLKVVYEQVNLLLEVDTFTVALYEGSKLQFPLTMRAGAADNTSLPSDENAAIQRVLRSQAPLLISQPATVSVYSLIGVPLLSGGHLLGAMLAASTHPRRRFDADELRLLSIVAATTGVALENAQLYRQQKERVGQLAMLNRILALLTDTLSPETVLDTVISSASMVAEATAVAVYLFWDDAKSTLALVRSAGLSSEFQAELPDPVIAALAKTQPIDYQKVITVTDVERDMQATYLRDVMKREHKAAWIELPLSFQGVGLGVLALYYDEPREFSPETIELLRAFANQGAQAITNARLYAITDEALERRVGQLLALATIGHQLSATMELQTICDLVIDYAHESTGATAAALLLTNEAYEITNVSSYGYPPNAVTVDRKLVVGGLSGQAVRSRDVVMVGEVQTDLNYVAFLPETRSQLSAPILWNENVVGVITLESDKANAFTEEDSYFVTQLANQAISAIENARLFRTISEARDRMQVILNTVKEGLILIGATGEVVLANPRVRLMGLKPDDLIGKSLLELLDQPDLTLSDRLGFRTSGELQRLIKELRSPDGFPIHEAKAYTFEDDNVRYIERQEFPVYDENDQPLGVLLVFYDETEEARLNKTREEVSQMLIHDLRSPLTSVTTSLKLLTDLVPKDNQYRPVIETTVDAGRSAIRKLLGRVDSLLDVSKMEQGFMPIDAKPTELATLVDNVCVEVSPMAQDLDVTIRSDLNADLPPLEIDADKIERVLLNLVDNALKFSPADSTVIVRAHEPGAEGAAPGFVRIDVVDSGPGVPDEYKMMLFDRYVQIRGRKGARRGTGLGLTFCRLVAETHGGRIWIDDNPTGGSIFSFTLPVAIENELDLSDISSDDQVSAE